MEASKTETIEAPEPRVPVSRRHPTSHATTRLAAVSDAVRSFLISELQAREVRVTRIAASAESGGGWETEAEILGTGSGDHDPWFDTHAGGARTTEIRCSVGSVTHGHRL